MIDGHANKVKHDTQLPSVFTDGVGGVNKPHCLLNNKLQKTAMLKLSQVPALIVFHDHRIPAIITRGTVFMYACHMHHATMCFLIYPPTMCVNRQRRVFAKQFE